MTKKNGSGRRGEVEERAVTIVIVSFSPPLAASREERAWSTFGVEDGLLGGRRMRERRALR